MDAGDPVAILLNGTYILLCLVGGILNIITMHILVRDDNLRKKFASVRWLMFGQAFAEFLVCVVAMPIQTLGNYAGDIGPYGSSSLFCAIEVFLNFGALRVSYWYHAILATTRLAAVLAPMWYRQYLKTRIANWALFAAPWIIVLSVYVVSALARAVTFGSWPEGSGHCTAISYDASPRAFASYSKYLMSDALITIFVPLIAGLVCYLIIYSYKGWNHFNKKRIQPTNPPNSNKVATATTPVASTAEAPASAAAASQEQPQNADKNPAAAAPVSLMQTTTTVKKLHEERDKKIKVLAIACIVNMAVVFPTNFFNSTNLSGKLPMTLYFFLWLAMYFPFPLNPTLYLLVSADFRQAYRKLFRCK